MNGVVEMTVDLFEDVRRALTVSQVSDIRLLSNSKNAKALLAGSDLSLYPLSQLNDMAEYLYMAKRDFADINEAQEFFRSGV